MKSICQDLSEDSESELSPKQKSQKERVTHAVKTIMKSNQAWQDKKKKVRVKNYFCLDLTVLTSVQIQQTSNIKFKLNMNMILFTWTCSNSKSQSNSNLSSLTHCSAVLFSLFVHVLEKSLQQLATHKLYPSRLPTKRCCWVFSLDTQQASQQTTHSWFNSHAWTAQHAVSSSDQDNTRMSTTQGTAAERGKHARNRGRCSPALRRTYLSLSLLISKLNSITSLSKT